jgi:hypothetical protein
MRPDCMSQMTQSPMPSKLNSPSAKGEAEEETEVTKDGGALHVTNTQVEVIDNKTRIDHLFVEPPVPLHHFQRALVFYKQWYFFMFPLMKNMQMVKFEIEKFNGKNNFYI